MGKRVHSPDDWGEFSRCLNPTAWVRASCCNSVFIMRLRSMKVPITIKTSYKKAEVPSLVDSGATDNFISPQTVRRLRLGIAKLDQPKRLFNVDDTQNKAGKVTHYVDLDVTTHQQTQKMRFLISDIGKESIILGYPWLAAFEPQFNWKEGTLNHAYLPIVCRSLKPQAVNAPSQEERVDTLTQLEAECTNRTISTDLAIQEDPKEEVIFPEEYQAFASVFSEEEAQRFPPSRSWDHAIDFKPGAPDAINCSVYPMMRTEDKALDDFLDEQLAKGYIHPSISPYALSFFFIKKKDDKLRPVQDYRKINQWTVRNQYPFPLIATLICDLGGASIYTKLDIRWGYNKVRIKKGDEHKAAFKTRRGLYEPTVMFFGLTNSPATFQAMMNALYREVIQKHEERGTIIRIYMDDIAVATKAPSMQLHTDAVSDILQVAKDNSLFFKLQKCIFSTPSIDYLGVILGKDGTKMDPVKVEAMRRWPIPTNVKGVRSFHGFCNFYRAFIAGFSKIAHPLNDLTKKGWPFQWTAAAQKAFNTLKDLVTREPVLLHPILTKPFELEVDASGYALGAVLMQQGNDEKQHPVGFYSSSLTPAERNYDIYDLQLLAIVKALQHWRPLLAGSPYKIKVFSDHMNLQYWRDPQKISRRVAREVLELADYDIEIHHLKGSANGRADALSRRPDYDQGEEDNEGVTVLPDALFIRTTRREGEEGQDESTIKRWVDPHQLKKVQGRWEKDGRMVVTAKSPITRQIISNHHDLPAYGHPGISRTTELVQRNYWWPTLRQDVIQYVRGCAKCQQHQVNTRPTQAPLSPIFPEEGALPFEVIAIDFITKLPTSRGYDSILTVTDHDCSKASLFIPCHEEISAEGVAQLFVSYVFCHYGLPRKIISDRDPRFTSKFMKELCQILGIKQNISMAYHPRMDGQSERTNQWLETYLRFFINHQQDDWATYLPLAEFAHNNWKSATTGESPFHLLLGSHPHAEWSTTPSALPQVTRCLEQLHQIRAQAQEAMTKAQEMWVKHRNTPQYQKGDLVWLEGRNLRTDQPAAKLAARRHGPFPIAQVMSPVTYQLTLPATWKLHPVFHTDLLTPYRETSFHGKNYQRPPPELIDGAEEYEIEKVLGERHHGRKKKRQYLVKWKGYPDSDNEWVNADDMNADEAVKEYERRLQKEGRKPKGSRIAHMSSSPISVASSPSSTSTHVLVLESLVQSAQDLAEARAAFPTPEPGRLSPDSTVSLDLAPTTTIRSTSVDEGSQGLEEGTTDSSPPEDRGREKVLQCRNLDGTSPEGSSGSEGGHRMDRGRSDRCQGERKGSCPFRTPSEVQRCHTHGLRHLECGELLQDCECQLAPLPIPAPPEPILPNIVQLLEELHNAGQREATTEPRGPVRGRGGRGRGRGTSRPTREEVRRRASSPEVRRIQPSPPPIRGPAGFSDNIPPNYINIKVRHQGRLHVARFIKVKFNDDPIVYGTMGDGLPVYEQSAYATPYTTAHETPSYSHADALLLHSKYPGQRVINNALIDIGDDGLRVEVHH